jgi:hypothetical protein
MKMSLANMIFVHTSISDIWASVFVPLVLCVKPCKRLCYQLILCEPFRYSMDASGFLSCLKCRYTMLCWNEIPCSINIAIGAARSVRPCGPSALTLWSSPVRRYWKHYRRTK